MADEASEARPPAGSAQWWFGDGNPEGLRL